MNDQPWGSSVVDISGVAALITALFGAGGIAGSLAALRRLLRERDERIRAEERAKVLYEKSLETIEAKNAELDELRTTNRELRDAVLTGQQKARES